MKKNKPYYGVYMGWIFLVTALALVAKKINLFSSGETGSHWWAFFLLIPVGGFCLQALRRWREGACKTSRNLVRAALMILPVFAASLCPGLWKVIYIPYIALLGVDMILGSIMRTAPPTNAETGEVKPPSESSKKE
ncbi:MAG: hypothetical protein JRE28_06655 [Deltaproteobacteria bacterium]|nr:hypothetical protein [Deltaproteobacteria bacterium]